MEWFKLRKDKEFKTQQSFKTSNGRIKGYKTKQGEIWSVTKEGNRIEKKYEVYWFTDYYLGIVNEEGKEYTICVPHKSVDDICYELSKKHEDEILILFANDRITTKKFTDLSNKLLNYAHDTKGLFTTRLIKTVTLPSEENFSIYDTDITQCVKIGDIIYRRGTITKLIGRISTRVEILERMCNGGVVEKTFIEGHLGDDKYISKAIFDLYIQEIHGQKSHAVLDFFKEDKRIKGDNLNKSLAVAIHNTFKDFYNYDEYEIHTPKAIINNSSSLYGLYHLNKKNIVFLRHKTKEENGILFIKYENKIRQIALKDLKTLGQGILLGEDSLVDEKTLQLELKKRKITFIDLIKGNEENERKSNIS